ncbi:family 1 glycosylhydrolase [Clavibacter sepedonicus]|uniref:family 1 glycosylhydrolase n=1 Tax=Clavibacter TaxID=1573 RepID=UPI0002F2335C|nr:family 1 glycosylhydrolase [Clavibacter sepedonicus]
MNHGALRVMAATGTYPTVPDPDPEIGAALVAAHRAAVPVIRRLTGAQVGWTVANQAFVALPGAEREHAALRHRWEGMYLEAAQGDDYIGVQSYTSQSVGRDGAVPHPEDPGNTLTGWAYRPDALGIAIRHTHETLPDVPVIVTENGIATGDDARRIEYTTGALTAMADAIADGIDVRGYCHWSLLDNFEWGRWKPTFGLVAVDRETFVRTPKPSLAWLGASPARTRCDALRA